MKYNLVYLSKSKFGGWTTFTSHLVLKYNFDLYQACSRTEKTKRKFGYNVFYKNIIIEELIKKDNLMITAVDKHHWELLKYFPDNTYIIIHDPNELKNRKNMKVTENNNILINNLKRFKCITIRETVQKYLINNFNIQSIHKIHPFFQYNKDIIKENNNFHALSISRIDYDKNIDIILKTNNLNKDENKNIYIFGFENRMYVHFYLKKYNFNNFWKGKYPKTFPLIYNNKSILNNTKFIIDLSIIKYDGGGTQYTFLDAIYNNCILILHKEWIEKSNIFQNKINCYAVGYTNEPEKELLNLINFTDENLNSFIINNSKKILNNNINSNWNII